MKGVEVVEFAAKRFESGRMVDLEATLVVGEGVVEGEGEVVEGAGVVGFVAAFVESTRVEGREATHVGGAKEVVGVAG